MTSIIGYCCPQPDLSGILIAGTAKVSVSGDPYDSFEMVLPLEEQGVGDADDYHDRTRHLHDGQGGDGSDLTLIPQNDVGVYCFPSQHCDGRQYITISPLDTLPKNCTVSLWGRIETFFTERTFFTRDIFSIGHDYLNRVQAKLTVQTTDLATTEYIATGHTQLTQNQFYHLAATWDGEELTVYVNGVADGTTLVSGTTSLPTQCQIARNEDTAHLQGNVQEVRLSGSARSPDWLLAEFNSWCMDFVSIGIDGDAMIH